MSEVENPAKVLFLCRANVARSQMAEGMYNQWAPEPVAGSAGVTDVSGLSAYQGRPADIIIQVMDEIDIDVRGQSIKQVTPQMVESAELIVVLCQPDILPDFLQSSALNIIFREVSDPYKVGIAQTREVRDQLSKMVREIIEQQSTMPTISLR